MEQLGNIENFYVCVKNYVQNTDILKHKKICMQIKNGVGFVPRAIGPVTLFNANGKKIVRKDLPKEPRTIEHDYHVIDWHGGDHYGTCYQTRECFQIEQILPPCEEIILDKDVIRSELLDKTNLERVKLIINIFLEIFGICELVDANKRPVSQRVIKTVPWTILPPGKYPWDRAKGHLANYLESIPEKRRQTIQGRHQILAEYEPDFLAIGEESFKGYVVYGYTAKQLYCFESNEPNNATYLFKGIWEDASKLTKRDIISGNLCYKRLIHSLNWKDNIIIELNK